jgi:hypothetical protein
MRSPSLLSQLLVGDLSPKGLDNAAWNEVIQQARASQTLAMLYHRLKQRVQLRFVPHVVQWHLVSAAKLAEKYKRDLALELGHIEPAVGAEGISTVLLKGAAYVTEGHPYFEGRIFSDIDLLIPQEKLPNIEKSLGWLGWGGGHHSEYDQRYYRQWMHELPPLIHSKRFTVLDLHHTILPLTAKYKPSGKDLLDNAVPLGNGLSRLSRVDQLLHSATHLFTDSEWDHAYRDLIDCDALIRLLLEEQITLEALLDRAKVLDLVMPLALVLRYTQKVLNTPVPNAWQVAVHAHYQPWLPWSWLDRLYGAVLCPPHPGSYKAISPFALRVLFIRGHALRMPLGLLVRHLSYKAFVVPFQKDKD